MRTVDTALALSMLTYFPELSHGGHGCIGEFFDRYFDSPAGERPETMFSGLCPDERSGVVAAMARLRESGRFYDMRIACDSTGSRRFNSFCVTDGCGTAYVVIGGNYRTGFYRSRSGVTSSWCDNFLGAVQETTIEQREILEFYDRAVSRLSGERIVVCGHSKGGNLAQYITLMRDSAEVCYSFDGQGFSEAFIKAHKGLIEERGGRIVSICPRRSIVGGALTPIGTAKRLIIKERPVRRGVLYSHIPAALFDRYLQLGEAAEKPSLISKAAGRVSVRTVWLAQKLPFISAENGLGHMGRALQFVFKGRPRRGLAELMSFDALVMLLLLPAEVPGAVFFGKE
ncbi:MAG: DUF2974 domain-containing protein [Ruminococcus sp.]|nr:DUF2974 domain-containing protein [Ruminococcus sp.]